MRPYSEKLKANMENEFPYCYFVEVDGCRIDNYTHSYNRVTDCAWFFADPPETLNPFVAKWHAPHDFENLARSNDDLHINWLRCRRSTHSAMLAMINNLEVDTIYWLSDFQDDQETKIAKAMVWLMKKKKITLHLHTLDRRPSSVWTKYAKASGGHYIRKKIK